MLFYSASTRGFYDSEVHGDARPLDCAGISRENYDALFAAQSQGKIIVPGADGKPFAVDAPQPSGNEVLLSQIQSLEATVTDRRAREAILGVDNGWLKNLNDQIASLRAQLTNETTSG